MGTGQANAIEIAFDLSLDNSCEPISTGPRNIFFLVINTENSIPIRSGGDRIAHHKLTCNAGHGKLFCHTKKSSPLRDQTKHSMEKNHDENQF